MPELRLQEDLLKAFRDERAMLDEQIALIEPLAKNLSRPAISRWARRGVGFVGEVICWILAVALIVGCFLLNKIPPFYLLFELNRSQIEQTLGARPIQMLQWGVYGLIIVIAILLVILARTIARVHRRNDLLHQAVSRIQKILDQNKKRKQSLEELEQKHFGSAGNTTQETTPSSPQ
jgi:hypothetical protein